MGQVGTGVYFHVFISVYAFVTLTLGFFHSSLVLLLINRVTKSSNQKIIDPEKVTYMLYMQSGFENLLVNDRVFATVEDDGTGDGSNNSSNSGGGGKARNKKKLKNQLMSLFSKSRGLKSDQKYRYFDDTVTRFPGEITKVW